MSRIDYTLGRVLVAELGLALLAAACLPASLPERATPPGPSCAAWGQCPERDQALLEGIDAYVADDLAFGVALREQTLLMRWPINTTPPPAHDDPALAANDHCRLLLPSGTRQPCTEALTAEAVTHWLAANPLDRAVLIAVPAGYTGVTAEVSLQALTGSVGEHPSDSFQVAGLWRFSMILDEARGQWVGTGTTAIAPDSSLAPLWPYGLAPLLCPGCR